MTEFSNNSKLMQHKKNRLAEPSGGKDTSMAKNKKAASRKSTTTKKTKTPPKAARSSKSEKAPKSKKEKPNKQTLGQKVSKTAEVSKEVKNKPTKRTRGRKWNRAHEFARKKSTEREVGHPVLIVGKRSRFRRFLVFTHTPEKGKEQDYEELKHNIDPDEEGIRKSHVKKKPEVSDEERLRAPDKQYRIHEEDKEIIKKYRQ